jgi:hypothetical protein
VVGANRDLCPVRGFGCGFWLLRKWRVGLPWLPDLEFGLLQECCSPQFAVEAIGRAQRLNTLSSL